ncbi:cysteine desulfurase [Tissierella creatinini]|nr:cysteine desulfurase [Tissierella creatinini]TJX62781.1 cysteine desulfurase [Soehngenia saccharolytica]
MIYLDNCATTKPRETVVKAMVEALQSDFGNPSSLHRLGISTENKIKDVRKTIGEFLKVDEKEIYFTSGGTESNNIALQSIINKLSRKGEHIITTNIEHPSIYNVLKHYESLGFEVTYLKVNNEGFINLNDLRNAIREDTILVSIIHVNNEIGVKQDIEGIREVIQGFVNRPLLHVDGIQSFGKVDLSINKIDTFSFSGHKVHGPKGIGGLYINKKLKLDPIVFGGNQESGLRSGTENVPGIIGLGEAVKILLYKGKEEREMVLNLKDYFIKRIEEEIEDVKINTPKDSSPYIVSITFRRTRGEVLLHYLEEKEIYISTTSACSSKGTAKSHVLKAIGLSDRENEGSIRICLSYEISKEDLDYTVEILKESIKDIRTIIRR